MTKDNLSKRGIENPPECVFCSEQETFTHLFFDCVVAKNMWQHICNFFVISLGDDFLSFARYWPASKNHAAINSVCACAYGVYGRLEIPISSKMPCGRT